MASKKTRVTCKHCGSSARSKNKNNYVCESCTKKGLK